MIRVLVIIEFNESDHYGTGRKWLQIPHFPIYVDRKFCMCT